ncbi:MAG TPA: hypothetical protein VFS25_25170 [Chitinophaga sp.]|uniref:hypothetical protein n=1 Tax=Chitinophaga sp. TaxID=1869181 RepID=UPI002DBAFAB4|nr:hypothetical protein [Chitinophaga sp.]HEU4556163.1 hypothetical protein [Chitinophaga sp.]
MRGNIFSPESILSNTIALLLLVLAAKRPQIARAMLSLIFIGAACYNAIVAIYYPERYLVYADLTASPLYETFIRGAFSRHITLYILVIALLQLVTGTLIGWKGIWMKLALAGAFTFLIAIAPLGAGSAFPCSIMLAAACLILIFDAGHDSLPEVLRRKYPKTRHI